MQIILIKYIQVFCLSLFLSNNINCDKKLLDHKHADEKIYEISSCTSICMEKDANLTLENCYSKCSESPSIKFANIKKDYENFEVKFICRSDTTIVLKIIKSPYGQQNKNLNGIENHRNNKNSDEDDGHVTDIWDDDDYGGNNSNGNDRNIHMNGEKEVISDGGGNNQKSEQGSSVHSRPRIFIFKISQANFSLAVSNDVYLADENIIEIQNLTAKTVYNISASVIHGDGGYSVVAKGIQFSTLERNHRPGVITEATLLNYQVNENDKNLLSAIFQWRPAKDMTCSYEILYYSAHLIHSEIGYVQNIVKVPKYLFTYKITNLTFGVEYHIGIRGKNSFEHGKESNFFWYNVTTPTCFEWYRDLSICPPVPPEDLSAYVTHLHSNDFSMNITWKKTEPEPNYFLIKILDLNHHLVAEPPNVINLNVSKSTNSVFLESVRLDGFQYEIYLMAVSPGGNSTAMVTGILEKHLQVTDYNTGKLVAAIITSVFCVATLAFVILIIFHRRAKSKRYQERCKYFEELERKAPVDPNSTFEFCTKNPDILPSIERLNLLQQEIEEKFFIDDEMEILRNDIELLEKLGEGAFGFVRKGILKLKDGAKIKVAVKMLKDPSVDDIKAFRREIDVMKSVGKHPNVVAIIGHCTKNINEMLLLTEYCNFGSLLEYLKSEWKFLNQITEQKTYTTRKRFSITENLTNDVVEPKINENIFNFDTSFVDKISFKYKNINSDENDSPTNKLELYNLTTTRIKFDNNKLKHNKRNENKDFILKSNDYPHGSSHSHLIPASDSLSSLLCTNSCKCKVDIYRIPQTTECLIMNETEIDSNNEKTSSKNNNIDDNCMKNKKSEIKIRNCDCKMRLSPSVSLKIAEISQSPQITSNPLLFVENKSYYKFLQQTNKSNNSNTENLKIQDGDNVSNSLSSSSSSSFSTKMGVIGRQPIKGIELLHIAKQIALGMEFLSKNKVVHRDLAARNVLVCENKAVKIADFGLSRDIYQENIYKKTGNGKLPIKWLALESMTHNIYTSQSDVWSFGVLLYEIVTLGGTPYLLIPTNQLLKLLKTGYRMERPKNCGQNLYDLMFSCWNANPNDRPTFPEICGILDDIITTFPDEIKIVASSIENNEESKLISNESYLKPI